MTSNKKEDMGVKAVKEIVSPIKKQKKKKNSFKIICKNICNRIKKVCCTIEDKLHVSSTMKKWGIISWTCVILLTLVFVIMYCQNPEQDYSSFVTIVGLAWGEVAVYNGCYCIKEKAENRLKIAYGFINDMADKYGIEAITPILQTIIQD